MSLYYQKKTCLIIDVSMSGIYCVPIHNHKELKDQSCGSFFGKEILQIDRYDWGNSSEIFHILPISREENSLEWENQASKVEKNKMTRRIIMGKQRCEMGEEYYEKLRKLVLECLSKLDASLKGQLLQNIIIRGGFSYINGLIPRIESDIVKACPKFEVNFVKSDLQDVIGGAKIMANLSDFKTKCEYMF